MHHIFNDSLSASDLCKQVRLSKELNPPPSTHTLKGALIRPPRYWSSGVLQGAFSNRIPGSRWLCSASMETSHSSTPPTLCQQLRAGARERTHTHTRQCSLFWCSPYLQPFHPSCPLFKSWHVLLHKESNFFLCQEFNPVQIKLFKHYLAWIAGGFYTCSLQRDAWFTKKMLNVKVVNASRLQSLSESKS